MDKIENLALELAKESFVRVYKRDHYRSVSRFTKKQLLDEMVGVNMRIEDNQRAIIYKRYSDKDYFRRLMGLLRREYPYIEPCGRAGYYFSLDKQRNDAKFLKHVAEFHKKKKKQTARKRQRRYRKKKKANIIPPAKLL